MEIKEPDLLYVSCDSTEPADPAAATPGPPEPVPAGQVSSSHMVRSIQEQVLPDGSRAAAGATFAFTSPVLPATATLLPCPFCGTSERDDEQERGLPAWIQLSRHPGAFSVECYGCGVESRWLDTAEQATAAWNRRGESVIKLDLAAAEPPELIDGGDWALARRIVAFLNDLLVLDSAALSALVAARVPCNAALAEHPTVQVGSSPDGGGTVGLLGILNGICGAIPSGPKEGWGPIAAVVEDDGRVSRFCLTTETPMIEPPQERWASGGISQPAGMPSCAKCAEAADAFRSWLTDATGKVSAPCTLIGNGHSHLAEVP